MGQDNPLNHEFTDANEGLPMSTETARWKVAPLFGTPCKKGPHHAAAVLSGSGRRSSNHLFARFDFAQALDPHGFAHSTKRHMSIPHGLEESPFALDNKPKGGEAIQALPHEDARTHARPVVVFKKQKQVVPEIQKSFFGALMLQGSAPQMVDMAPTCRSHCEAPVFQPPAQVNLFHVGEKVFIQPLNLKPRLCPDQKRSPRCPKHGLVFVVLTQVQLVLIEHPACAEHKAVAVHVSTRRTCVFEFSPVLHSSNFRLSGRPSMLFTGRAQPVNPSCRDFHIAVQQQETNRQTMSR